jgi:Ras-related protein Rab-32
MKCFCCFFGRHSELDISEANWLFYALLQAQNGERREHLYKILVIGELGTGKTSIIKRYVHQFFSQHYRATIGVDFALKVLTWDQNTIIRLQLWDIAGLNFQKFTKQTKVLIIDLFTC